ncbi:DUF3833 domain-containing protein [Sphingosinicellaceae bacterium]|nr:DUF3833 domain-containing protein [Sphingosinicellaceae bacterium]
MRYVIFFGSIPPHLGTVARSDPARKGGRSTSLSLRYGGAFAAAILVAACVPSDHVFLEQAPAPGFDPIVFFAGHTEGRGSLAVVLQHRNPTLVEGHGVVASDGSIDLDQIVRKGDGKPTRRTWHLYRVSPARYSGTLSDARGMVTGTVEGNQLHLIFDMKNGLHAQQFLYLRSNGQSARNRMIVTKLGIPVASLDETIVRLPE